MPLTEKELQILSESIVSRLRHERDDFHIDREMHYLDHMQRREWVTEDYDAMRDLVRLFKMTRSLFGKAFVGFAIVGSIVMAVVGALIKHG